VLVTVTQIPMATRWTLYALGAVDGQRVRRPRDPVAAWLLRRQPKLLPPTATPSILTMIRARTALVDRMIEEEVARARRLGLELAYWGFGVGFDARWYRLMALMGDVVRTHREMEDPEILSLKSDLLEESTFARAWGRIVQLPAPALDWQVEREPGRVPVVVLEGVATRVTIPSLRTMLAQIRKAAPGARVVMDLPATIEDRPADPAELAASRGRWGSVNNTAAHAISTRQLVECGYRVVEDVQLAARPELRGSSGGVLCAGMEALRVLRLSADAPVAEERAT
jgi:hypothetical protein